MMAPSGVAGQSVPISVESQLQATLAQTQTWMTLIDNETSSSDQPQSSALGRIGVDGPGWLAYDDRGHRVFARQAVLSARADGYIVNERGALALGYAGTQSTDPVPIRVAAVGVALPSVTVDESGRIIVSGGRARAARDNHQEVAGRLAIALSAYPRESLGTQLRYLPAGMPHVGTIKRNPPVIPSDAVRADIRLLWDASGRGELQVALAESEDALERTALNLVR